MSQENRPGEVVADGIVHVPGDHSSVEALLQASRAQQVRDRRFTTAMTAGIAGFIVYGLLRDLGRLDTGVLFALFAVRAVLVLVAGALVVREYRDMRVRGDGRIDSLTVLTPLVLASCLASVSRLLTEDKATFALILGVVLSAVLLVVIVATRRARRTRDARFADAFGAL
jgi:uncharacterized membrane protein